MSEISYADSADGLTAHDLEPFFAGWPDAPDPGRRLAILLAADEVIVARSVDGALAGFVTAITDHTFAAFIPLLEVHPAIHGRGVGTELMRRMLARLNGYYSIDLVCDEDVAAFYEEVGGRRLSGFGWRNRERLGG